MATTLDMSSDYGVFDNTESVTVTLKSTSESIVVASALRRQANKREQNAHGAWLTRTVTTWEIPQSQLGSGKSIAEGDRIVDASRAWTVTGVNHCNSGTRWRCYCTEEQA